MLLVFDGVAGLDFVGLPSPRYERKKFVLSAKPFPVSRYTLEDGDGYYTLSLSTLLGDTSRLLAFALQRWLSGNLTVRNVSVFLLRTSKRPVFTFHYPAVTVTPLRGYTKGRGVEYEIAITSNLVSELPSYGSQLQRRAMRAGAMTANGYWYVPATVAL